MKRFESYGRWFSCGIAIAFFACVTASAADPKLPKGSEVYDAFPLQDRPLLRAGYAHMIKAQTASVEQAKKQFVRANGPKERETAKKELEEQKAYLEFLKETNDPPAIGCPLDSWGTGGYLPEDPHRPPVWHVGAIGPSSCTFDIIQVVDARTAIARRKVIGDWQSVMLKGFDTSDWTDDSKKTFANAGPLWVSGTTDYRTLLNAKRTVIVVEPFDWKRYRDAAKAENEK